MKLISWNVNGFRAVTKKNAFEWINEINPDILCFQEVKADISQVQPFPHIFEKYPYYFWNESKIKKGYSGTAVFSKTKPDNVIIGIGIEEFDNEGRVIELEYKDFVLLNIYFPNSGRDGRMSIKLRFNDAIYDRVKKLQKAGKNVIVTGDYNVAHQEIDIARPKENDGYAGFTKEERDWMTKFLSMQMIDTFRYKHPDEKNRYSWWNMRFKARDRNIGWRIDYFCVSTSLLTNIIFADILDHIMGSDHAPIYLEII